MQITLFNFEKRVNSTKQPPGNTGVNVEIALKNDIDFINPTFYLDIKYKNYNYLKWDNRYYYINNKSIVNLNTVALSCNIDYLRTYKTNIQNTNAFVIYSSSNYDTDLIDVRVPLDIKTRINVTSKELFNDLGTTYIVQYVTDNATYGSTGLLWLDGDGVGRLASSLTNTDFLNLENFEKQITNAYQAVQRLSKIPLNLIPKRQGTRKLRLSSYDTGIVGYLVSQRITYTTTITLPRVYGDFRDYQNIDYLLYLPAYGFVMLNKNDYIGKTINIRCAIDGVTGEGTYIVGDTQKFTTNFATSLSIGTVSSNFVGYYSNMISAAANTAVGNIGGGLIRATQASLSVFQRNLGNVGNQGGIAGVIATIPKHNWQDVLLITINHNSTISPDSLTDIKGRPCQSIQRIGDLTGYCQTDNVSVQTDNYTATQYINNMLNGGVYIE